MYKTHVVIHVLKLILRLFSYSAWVARVIL
jgi:hypothetical protein